MSPKPTLEPSKTLNWKTSLFGLVSVFLSVGLQFAAPDVQKKVMTGIGLSGGLAAILSKDHDTKN